MVLVLLLVAVIGFASDTDKSSVSQECVRSTMDWIRGQVGDTITVNNVDSLVSDKEVDDIGHQPTDWSDSLIDHDTVYWYVPIVSHTADSVARPSGCTESLMLRIITCSAGGDCRSIDLTDTSKRVVQPLAVSVGDAGFFIEEWIIFDRASQSYIHIRDEYEGDSLAKHIEQRMFK